MWTFGLGAESWELGAESWDSNGGCEPLAEGVNLWAGSWEHRGCEPLGWELGVGSWEPKLIQTYGMRYSKVHSELLKASMHTRTHVGWNKRESGGALVRFEATWSEVNGLKLNSSQDINRSFIRAKRGENFKIVLRAKRGENFKILPRAKRGENFEILLHANRGENLKILLREARRKF